MVERIYHPPGSGLTSALVQRILSESRRDMALSRIVVLCPTALAARTFLERWQAAAASDTQLAIFTVAQFLQLHRSKLPPALLALAALGHHDCEAEFDIRALDARSLAGLKIRGISLLVLDDADCLTAGLPEALATAFPLATVIAGEHRSDECNALGETHRPFLQAREPIRIREAALTSGTSPNVAEQLPASGLSLVVCPQEVYADVLELDFHQSGRVFYRPLRNYLVQSGEWRLLSACYELLVHNEKHALRGALNLLLKTDGPAHQRLEAIERYTTQIWTHEVSDEPLVESFRQFLCDAVNMPTTVLGIQLMTFLRSIQPHWLSPVRHVTPWHHLVDQGGSLSTRLFMTPPAQSQNVLPKAGDVILATPRQVAGLCADRTCIVLPESNSRLQRADLANVAIRTAKSLTFLGHPQACHSHAQMLRDLLKHFQRLEPLDVVA